MMKKRQRRESKFQKNPYNAKYKLKDNKTKFKTFPQKTRTTKDKKKKKLKISKKQSIIQRQNKLESKKS